MYNHDFMRMRVTPGIDSVGSRKCPDNHRHVTESFAIEGLGEATDWQIIMGPCLNYNKFTSFRVHEFQGISELYMPTSAGFGCDQSTT